MKLYFTLILLVALRTSSLGQDSSLYQVMNLTLDQGLSHNGITQILKDSRGFYWFSSYDGLNRYDGYQVKVYKNTPDKQILSSNRILCLAEDSNRNIWLGTEKGITVYFVGNRSFKIIDFNSSDQNLEVIKILPDTINNKIICLTSRGDIYVYNTDYSCEVVSEPPEKHKATDGVLIEPNRIVYTTTKGLWEYNISHSKFTQILKNKLHGAMSIAASGSDCLIIALHQGIAIVQVEKELLSTSYDLTEVKYLEDRFRAILVDKQGGLWYGKNSCKLIYVQDVDEFVCNDRFQYKEISYSAETFRISCVLISDLEDCWVGTFDKGVFNYKTKDTPFKFFNSKKGNEYRIKQNKIVGLIKLDKNRICVRPNVGKAVYFNTETNDYEPHDIVALDMYQPSAYLHMVDVNGYFWIKHGNGYVYKQAPGNELPIKLEHPDLPKIRLLEAILDDKNGNVWIGEASGLHRLSFNDSGLLSGVENMNDNHYFNDHPLDRVFCMYIDESTNRLWFGTYNQGLFFMENYTDSLKKVRIRQFVHSSSDVKSISADFITSIVRISSGEMFIGTEGGGFCKVIEKNGDVEFKRFTEKNGLSNNVVKNIILDIHNNLWISTNNGLNKYDTENNVITAFGKSDGLPFTEFLYPAVQLENKNLAFAGVDGFFYFNPEKVTSNNSKPRIHLDEFRLFNKIILPGDSVGKRILIDKPMDEIKGIKLKHNENVFALSILSLHYSNPQNYNIKYRLLPFSESWTVTSSDQNMIHFKGLRPGEYCFEYAASASNKDWSDTQKFNITIQSAWWNTVLARIVFICIALAILILGVQSWVRIKSLAYNLRIKQLEKNRAEEINEAKLRYFSNISHEIKTPLSLIQGPLEVIWKRLGASSELGLQIEAIERQAAKISRLVDQVHDFQKSEAELLKLDYSQFGLNSFILELIKDFEIVAEQEGKTILVSVNDFNTYVSADKDKLDKILSNVLSNALKFTEKGDKINFRCWSQGKNVYIEIVDTGIGIGDRDLPHIFERFYQAENIQHDHVRGSGIGLAFTKRLVEMHFGTIEADSKFGSWTKLKISLPIVWDIKDNLEYEDTIILEEEKQYSSKIFTGDRNAEQEFAFNSDNINASVFLVEDNFELRKFISDVLDPHYKVTSFSSGRDCLVAMDNEWPDLIVSDILMPHINGLELCRKIKSDIKTCHIQVVLLTACVSIEDEIKGMEVGADAYLKKPFSLNLLLSTIELKLNIRKQLRERFSLDLPLTLENTNKKDQVFLEKLYGLFEENMDKENVDFYEMARRLYLNRSQFYKKVKELTNTSPYDLLKRYRLQKATEFLVQDNMPVGEIMALTGFKSRSHFNKVFRIEYGMAPSEFKEKNYDQ